MFLLLKLKSLRSASDILDPAVPVTPVRAAGCTPVPAVVPTRDQEVVPTPDQVVAHTRAPVAGAIPGLGAEPTRVPVAARIPALVGAHTPAQAVALTLGPAGDAIPAPMGKRLTSGTALTRHAKLSPGRSEASECSENADLGIDMVSEPHNKPDRPAHSLAKILNRSAIPGGAEGNRTPDLIIANVRV